MGMQNTPGAVAAEAEPAAYTGYLIRRAQQLHVAAWQRKVSATTSNVQFGALAVLARRPGASQQDLCEELDLDRSTIADLVRRLERNGLIERKRDSTDRRRNRLVVSAAGLAALDDLRPRVEDVERVLTGALSADERRTLRELLRKILATTRTGDLESE